MLLGSHLSIAGGLHKAAEKAGEYGFAALAMFVRNQVQWRVPPLSEESVERFRAARRRAGISRVVAHGSYLVNLAGLRDVRRRSIGALKADLDRCGRLGIEYLVLHPGVREDRERGIRLISDALNAVIADCPHRRPKVLLETTAGQGRSIGHRLEDLAEILAGLDRPRRFGICLDTCHAFAAGYDLRTPASCAKTLDELDRVVGLRRLLAIHLNDSKRPFGSRVDRHEHIGRGAIGRKGFAALLQDPRLADIPMILETPKGKDPRGRDWDTINAGVIRRLACQRGCGLQPQPTAHVRG
jgi:deoxyribonuclease IV